MTLLTSLIGERRTLQQRVIRPIARCFLEKLLQATLLGLIWQIQLFLRRYCILTMQMVYFKSTGYFKI